MSPTPPVVVSQTLRRRRGLTEQAAVAAVDHACRRLRLPTIRAVLDEALSVAGKEQLSIRASWPSCCWQSVMTGTAVPQSEGSSQPASHGINGSGISISTPTRTSTKQQSTPWPKETGSVKARPCASSATQAPVNPTCSSASAQPPQRKDSE